MTCVANITHIIKAWHNIQWLPGMCYSCHVNKLCTYYAVNVWNLKSNPFTPQLSRITCLKGCLVKCIHTLREEQLCHSVYKQMKVCTYISGASKLVYMNTLVLAWKGFKMLASKFTQLMASWPPLSHKKIYLHINSIWYCKKSSYLNASICDTSHILQKYDLADKSQSMK